MPTIIAFIVVTCIGLALNDFVGLIQADSIYFWKNSESKAKEVTTLLENRKVINIPQKKIFESLNGEFDSVSDVKQTKKLKKQLIGSTVEWVLRVEEVRKFGSRYQVISKNESPSSNEYEEMGKNFAKYLFGSKDKGSVISMCGTSYVYPQSPEVENKLDNLKEGDIIRVRGIVDRFEWQSDPFGILKTFSNLLWVTNSEKDIVKVFNCPVLSKAILTQNQEGKKYSVYSKETQDILNRGNAIVNGFKEGFQKNSDTKNLDNQPKNVEQDISDVDKRIKQNEKIALKSKLQCITDNKNAKIFQDPHITSDSYDGIGSAWTFITHKTEFIGGKKYLKGHMVSPRGGHQPEIEYIDPIFWDCQKPGEI